MDGSNPDSSGERRATAAFTVRPLTDGDRGWIARFTEAHWGDEIVIAHGEIFHPADLPGFVATNAEGEVLGLVTCSIDDGQCEIVTLDSVRENVGVGTALLRATRELAGERGCSRLWLITTNDNLRALGFYQRRGFELVAVHRGALERSRRLKPSIPEVSADGVPLRDELELEQML